MMNSSDQAHRIIANNLALCVGICGGILIAGMVADQMPNQSAEKERGSYSVAIDRQIFHVGRVTY